ncbi:MAG: aminopeptidase P family protein [Clostridiales Family XIII bacterium]|jgi:Xaa-Pro aminopeptidase|nr:aminopeptidase P family protein [Clostridiales Family XIII bacterium]
MGSAFGNSAMLVTDAVNQRYFHRLVFATGVTYISDKRQTFVTWAKTEETALPGAMELLQTDGEALGSAVKGLLIEDGSPCLTVERTIPLFLYSAITAQVEKTRIASHDVIGELRETKNEWELEQIQKASEITDYAFDQALGFIKPGVSEIEIAAFLEYHMRLKGGSESNKTIVACGKNSAFPHHWPTDCVVQKGDFLTVDFGCSVNGYHSDLTRTLFVGKATNRQKEIYNLVHFAQQAGIDALRAGKKGGDIDKIARDIIDGTEYAGRFVHGLGHGIGLCIHEGTGLGKGENGILKNGMVVSVEPGIYIEGYGGVRIEDIAVIETHGAKVLEHADKGLIEL